MSSHIFSNELKKNGYSMTSPRLNVYNALVEHNSVTMTELIQSCKPVIDRATVYRTIKLFEQLGFVRRIQIGWKYKLELSDLFTKHHHHITCRKCNSTQEIVDDPTLNEVIKRMTKNSKFITINHELEVAGICPNCQE